MDCIRGLLDGLQGGPSDPQHVPLYVTGHSLGGALAVLAAERLTACGYPVMEVHTFGGPRVGDYAWAQAYEARLGRRTWRHAYCCDIVTRVPWLWQGYWHVGQHVYYDSFAYRHHDPPALLVWCDRIWSRLNNWGHIPTCGLRHHLLRGYLRCLQDSWW